MKRSDAVRVAAADIVKPPLACVCHPRQAHTHSVIAARGRVMENAGPSFSQATAAPE
jgi:hypothetical protein